MTMTPRDTRKTRSNLVVIPPMSKRKRYIRNANAEPSFKTVYLRSKEANPHAAVEAPTQFFSEAFDLLYNEEQYALASVPIAPSAPTRIPNGVPSSTCMRKIVQSVVKTEIERFNSAKVQAATTQFTENALHEMLQTITHVPNNGDKNDTFRFIKNVLIKMEL